MELNQKIINKIKSDDYLETSILNNEIINKNDYIYKSKNINKQNIRNFFIISYFIIVLIIYNPFTSNYYKNKLKPEIEFLSIEKYFKICNNNILLRGKKKEKRKENPEISIISAVYNKQNYIIRFLRSIQNQNIDKIEIILVDDFSEDKTVNIIEKCQKEDERIILLKNKYNKGALISRNEGILISRGKYIIIPDSDDILSKDILKQCLMIAEGKNYDMIRFNIYLGNKNIFMYKEIKYLVDKSIYQPELSSYIFYGLGYLKIIDPMISNKFIKRNILINALNSINIYYLNQNMIFYEDTLINILIYKVSNSYYFFRNIGYFYISNPNSSTMGYNKNENNYNKLLNSFFLFLKFIFYYTKNNQYEKDMANEAIKKEKKILLLNKYQKNKNNKLFQKIINLYLKNKFITLSTKNILYKIKYYIKKID